MIRIQQHPFDVASELALLRGQSTDIGGIALFIGSVREIGQDGGINFMTLEHYPGMTEAALVEIDDEAHRRWPLFASLVVHRYGKLSPGDDIVLVIVASAHRKDAFEACQFLMDWLKTKAPFWKLESGGAGDHWVEAKTADDALAARWEHNGN